MTGVQGNILSLGLELSPLLSLHVTPPKAGHPTKSSISESGEQGKRILVIHLTHYNRLPYGSKKKFIEFLKEVESDNMDLDFMDFYEAYKKVKALQEKKTGTKKPKKVSQQK